MSRRRFGLTVLEVLVAVFILAVGVLGVFGLQASALSGSRVAVVVQELANIARSELEIQSEFRRLIGSPVVGESCRTLGVAPGYACTVIVYPCTATASSVSCVNSNVTQVAAHQVVVRVTSPDGREVSLATIVKAR